jgi:SWI/SNF-related matrix-associated actin-dependent regulator of chromatin subfamily A3
LFRAPAIEDQAVDRVHRLGQTRETRVFRLVMRDSIEDRVIAVQKRKRDLMMLAFAERQGKRGKETAARLADIESLLA